MSTSPKQMNARFQGYLPIVLDVETGGCNPKTDALLEIGAVAIHLDPHTLQFSRAEEFHQHVIPFENAVIEAKALEINHIDPYHPFRFAVSEKEGMHELFSWIHQLVRKSGCRRAVLVGHNAAFDLSFIQAAAKRVKLQNQTPFHRFTCFDTATLCGLMYGKTVLARALALAGIEFDKHAAHSALYDAQKTAEIFCKILNQIPFPGTEGFFAQEDDEEEER